MRILDSEDCCVFGGLRTTLAADILKNTESFFAKYARSNCCIKSVSGASQYVTDEVTRKWKLAEVIAE